ncbi:aminotransferase [Penicillium macrosclerotiorum]|uniref:aminotransferase n=1 Tax=Penicillium macrosclerotiorum TaxID=303699 RepID=UPI002548CDBB|nr:aminotransferase [Penicillium macrosclerotiorum]KAJ5689583.1 aminotransferase [Penicillium macrosclerotiorum]
MVKIDEFAVERWMDDYENDARFNLAETCCASISLTDLLELSGNSAQADKVLDFSKKQVYGAIRGSVALRTNIARLYVDELSTPVPGDQVLVTNGAIQANFLALYTNVGPGDHVICHYPTYQQLYSVPKSLGAEVSLWKSRETEGWRLDLDELKSLIRPNTKYIVINNPQNPTGAVLSHENLKGIVDIAREHGIILHSDEVYRPLFHSLAANTKNPPSVLSFGYEKTVVTGSMSKAFSLAGIRLGWIVSLSSAIIEACASARDYTVISVSQVDDQIATFALDSPTVDNLLTRNITLAQRNLAALDEFVTDFKYACQWTRPQAGTTAFIRFSDKSGSPVDDVEFCKQLQQNTGVMFVPGSQCFGGGVDFKGFVRVGYVNEHQTIIDGLEALRVFMGDGYSKLPLA